MKTYMNDLKEMRSYLLLWFTQTVSGLGSAMTAYALVIWSYTQAGSALRTALLMVCSYAPYVVCSIFAGALSDRWDKKKTMLACDALAAISVGLEMGVSPDKIVKSLGPFRNMDGRQEMLTVSGYTIIKDC